MEVDGISFTDCGSERIRLLNAELFWFTEKTQELVLEKQGNGMGVDESGPVWSTRLDELTRTTAWACTNETIAHLGIVLWAQYQPTKTVKTNQFTKHRPIH